MSKVVLSDVHKVYQDTLQDVMRFCIKTGDNLCTFGPSGGGKTAMAFQIIEEQKCNPVYINLSVLERPDFQGWPAPAQGQLIASYATPEFLPFEDTRYYKEKEYLEDIASMTNTAEMSPEAAGFVDLIRKRLSGIERYDKQITLKKALPYLKDSKELTAAIAKQIEILNKTNGALFDESRPNVLLFDEADKAPHEVLQPLLEVTQFHTVNGRPLNIKSCFLLCNLPDEGAHSEHLSHALTKRCKVLQLDVAFPVWRKWAFKNNIHPLIIGFLASNADLLHDTSAAKNDPTAYAQPTPRSWEYASNTLYSCENQELNLFDKNSNQDSTNSSSITTSLIAANVGLHAALKLENWIRYYHTLDHVIEGIVEKGVQVGDDLQFDQKLVVALGACNRIKMHLKPGSHAEMTKVAKNVFRWLNACDVEIQIGALRGAFDWQEVEPYKLTDIKEVQQVVDSLTDKLS